MRAGTDAGEGSELLALLRRGDLPGAIDAAVWPDPAARPPAGDRPFFARDNLGHPCGPPLEAELPAGGMRAAFGEAGRLLGAGGAAGLGAALLAAGDYLREEFEGALERLEGAGGRGRARFWPAYLRALALLRGGPGDGRARRERALEAVSEAVEAEPRACAYCLRARLHFEAGRTDASIGDARRAVALEPRDTEAGYYLMESLLKAGRTEEAVAEARRASALRPPSGYGLARAARILGIVGQHDRALSNLDRAVSLNPRCAVFRAWRSEVKRRLGREGEALADLDEAAALDPGYALTFTWRGRLKHNWGDFEGALADFDESLRLAPSDRRTRAWRAGCQWRMGRCRQAALEFEALHPLEPAGTWNRGREGDAKARTKPVVWGPEGDPFLRDLDRGVEARPRDPWAWAFRGRCLAGQHRPERGLGDLAKAIRLDGSLAYAYRWRGELHRRLGLRREALADLRAALRLEPGHPVAAEFLRRAAGAG